MSKRCNNIMIFLKLLVLMVYSNASLSQIPAITGSPEIDTPRLLEWPLDIPATSPDLSEPTSNRIFDLHAHVSNCEDTNIVLSTSGNYHMALRDLWYDYYLPKTQNLVRNWYYTTSPPISAEQIQNKTLTFGNLRLECTPSLAVGPVGLMNNLKSLNIIEGEPIPVIRNFGNVILVKKGNPKNIRNIWDLRRPNIRVVTSNPDTEPGSFGNYMQSVFDIANNDPDKPYGWTAEMLFNSIFNGGRPGYWKHFWHHKRHKHNKWLTGKRIHHREVPWSLAYGDADAGLMFYHLALYMVRTFPDLYDIVPLGGTVDMPEPVPGNRVATLFVARVAGNFNADQIQAREELIGAYLSEYFDRILQNHGLRRPFNFRGIEVVR